jgi:hypothetical protein
MPRPGGNLLALTLSSPGGVAALPACQAKETSGSFGTAQAGAVPLSSQPFLALVPGGFFLRKNPLGGHGFGTG